MKELSIEEKAKAYDEAFERARQIHNEHKAQCFDVMTKLFPELAESEDERIRKSLINYVYCHGDAGDFTKKEFIAWLEKCAPKKHNDVGQYIKLNCEPYSFMIPSDLYPRLDGYNQQLWRKEIEYAYSNGRKDERKECEQKLAWSEEDEITKNNISYIIRQYDKISKGENQPCWYVGDCLLWMQNIKDRVQLQNITVTDEELAQAKKEAYNDALDKIEYHSGEPTFDDGWGAAIWYLKNRNAQPQNTWEPSDEDMEFLQKICRTK